MRYSNGRQSDDHPVDRMAVLDIETVAPVAPDDAFPPWPSHQIILASVLTADRVDGGHSFSLATVLFEGREAEAVAEVDQRLRGRTLITYNGRGFDLPVLSLTAMRAGAFGARALSRCWLDNRYGANHLDLAEQFGRYGAARGASLAGMCEALGIPVKTTVAGGDVAQLHAAGELDAIGAYCEEDVVGTFLAALTYIAFRKGDERAIADPLSAFVRWLEAKGSELAHLQQFTRMPTVPWAHRQSLRCLAADALAHNVEATRREAEDRVEWFTHAM